MLLVNSVATGEQTDLDQHDGQPDYHATDAPNNDQVEVAEHNCSERTHQDNLPGVGYVGHILGDLVAHHGVLEQFLEGVYHLVTHSACTATEVVKTWHAEAVQLLSVVSVRELGEGASNSGCISTDVGIDVDAPVSEEVEADLIFAPIEHVLIVDQVAGLLALDGDSLVSRRALLHADSILQHLDGSTDVQVLNRSNEVKVVRIGRFRPVEILVVLDTLTEAAPIAIRVPADEELAWVTVLPSVPGSSDEANDRSDENETAYAICDVSLRDWAVIEIFIRLVKLTVEFFNLEEKLHRQRLD